MDSWPHQGHFSTMQLNGRKWRVFWCFKLLKYRNKTLIILNFLKVEGALNYVEITVKQKMDCLPYKFDLIDSIINIFNDGHFNQVFFQNGKKIIAFKA